MKIIFAILFLFYENVDCSRVNIKSEIFTQTEFKKFLGNDFKFQLKAKFDRENLISKALTDVIDEFFIKQEIDFDVIIFEPISENFPNIIDLTLARVKKTRPIVVRKTVEFVHVLSSAVIFIDWSIHKNADLNRLINVLESDPRDLKFLFYYTNCKSLKAQAKLSSKDSMAFPISVYGFVVCHQNETAINLVTHEWFKPKGCNKRETKVLNSFNFRTRKWRTQLRNYRKFRNFHGCHFEIQDYHEQPGIKELSVPIKNTPIFDVIARKANFTFEFVNREEITTEIVIYPGYLVTDEDNAITSISRMSKVGLIVTEGEPYTNYEKLVLPFDALTWILLLTTFASAFMIIFCINQMNKKIKELVFGKGVTMPAFNVVGTFFGIGQTKLPRGNFSRFILMMFIIFCLIFRTGYQGVLFDFMNSDMRKPHARTIDQVFEENFTLVVHPTMDVDALLFYLEREGTINVEFQLNDVENVYEGICEIVTENKPKTAVVIEETILTIVNSMCEKKAIKIQETLLVIPVGLATIPLHYMFEFIEDTIQSLIPTGILKHSEDFYRWLLFREKYFEIDDGPKVLTLSDLSYGFNIWLLTLGIAILGFIMEIIVHKFMSWKKTKVLKTVKKRKMQNPIKKSKMQKPIKKSRTKLKTIKKNRKKPQKMIQKKNLKNVRENKIKMRLKKSNEAQIKKNTVALASREQLTFESIAQEESSSQGQVCIT